MLIEKDWEVNNSIKNSMNEEPQNTQDETTSIIKILDAESEKTDLRQVWKTTVLI